MFTTFPCRFGRYTLERLISEAGGQGEVFEATDRNLERRVAVKVLRPALANNDEFIERFFGEAEILMSLDHRNVVKVSNTGEIDGAYFIEMELIDGLDLRQWTRRHGSLPIEVVVLLLLQVSAGLNHAHAKGVIHRDVKPENVMLTGRGDAKVLDFGLGRVIDEEVRRTVDGTVMGTWAYMSPEQLDGKPATIAFDIYSLGAVAYELISTQPPFTGTPASIYNKVHTQKPDPIGRLRPETPAMLSVLVHEMLGKKPEQRPRGLLDVHERLRHVAQGFGALGHDDLVVRYVADPAGVSSMLSAQRKRH
jgi:serine/threonine-protein kinase